MIGPYEFRPKFVWRSKFSESFSLDRYWSIEFSFLQVQSGDRVPWKHGLWYIGWNGRKAPFTEWGPGIQ